MGSSNWRGERLAGRQWRDMRRTAKLDRTGLLALPPVLRAGFRPFFLLAPLWALTVVVLWISALAGKIVIPSALDPLSWHRHEMLFGFLSAAIAGFLLTAIPNWTGRLPIAGWRLALLVLIWMAARLAVLFSAFVGGTAAMLFEAMFMLALAGACAREVLIARNRNLPVVAVLVLFALAALADQMEGQGIIAAGQIGWRAGLSLVLILVSLIGGRIIPSFTANWLARRGHSPVPRQASGFDHLVIAGTGIALAAWAFHLPAEVTAVLLLAAAALQLLRLARWSGHRTTAEPLLLFLHLSYGWLPIGLLLLGLSIANDGSAETAGIHALTAGAMASMVLAVMTRVSLGHTGRDLHAGNGTVAIYLLVTGGAILRVVAPWLSLDYLLLLQWAGALWGGAFLLFLLLYGPNLLGPRPDAKP